MALIHAQVTLYAQSADSADNNVNGFAVSLAGAPAEADLDTITVLIKDFYDDVIAIGGLRGIVQNNHLVKWYDIEAGPPNYPIYETTFNLASAPNPVEMPMEVALAVSYKNNTLNTIPRARRRGRIFISGWSESANTTGRPISTVYEGLATAYQTYADGVNAIAGYVAGIWSRRDATVYPVEECWCDNEWDTQRRRGTRPTARATEVITP